jgi:hypothetical protein
MALFHNDAADRAVYFANAAIDALIGIDDVDVAFRDAVDGAVGFARTTGDASVKNFSGHENSPFLLSWTISNIFYKKPASLSIHFSKFQPHCSCITASSLI